jgi:hypothetical protein
MKYSTFHLDDLPDEILMIIFRKLNNLLLLYSLIGVNKRLNKIIQDPVFTRHLSLIQSLSIKFVHPLPEPILERFCSDILPVIYDKIQCLDLESSSVERILLSTKYPNLCGLGLFNIQEKTAMDLFTGKIFDFDSFNNKYT